jgi:hypothetical protein
LRGASADVLSILNRRKKLGIPAAVKRVSPDMIGSKHMGKMKTRDYAKAANRTRAKRGGRSRKPTPKAQRKAQKPPSIRPLPVPLSEVLGGKRIKELTADEFLAAAQLIWKLKRS